MKNIAVFVITLFLPGGCQSQPPLQKEAYSWINFENIPKDSTGKINGTPDWGTAHKLDIPVDTFVIYKNNDSIRMISLDAPAGKLFRKVNINASRWKPRSSYGKEFLFLGTYEREGLDGLYFSFYATRNWNNLMQVVYTNPGNLNAAVIFSRDSVNILKQMNIIIDPKDEITEPEAAR